MSRRRPDDKTRPLGMLEFRCRDHPSMRVLIVEHTDAARELTVLPPFVPGLVWIPAEAARRDEAGALWFASECPQCRRPLVWTEGAVRNELARACDTPNCRRVVHF